MLSILIPVHNEQTNLTLLLRELRPICEKLGEVEVLIIDDGSQDQTGREIETWTRQWRGLSGIRLPSHQGKGAALAAGVRAARGSMLLTLDGDLQDPPENIPRLLGKLSEGFDLVVGWRKHRKDPWTKRFQSRLFNWTLSRCFSLPLHDHNCGMKCMRVELARSVTLENGWYRFLAVSAKRAGFRVTEAEVKHRPRKIGRSKYGTERIFSAALGFARLVLQTRRIRAATPPAPSL